MSTDSGYGEPPRVGSEIDTLAGSLERMRATFWFKCTDLDSQELRARFGASELTLGRLLKHLAYMEDLNFTRDLDGSDLPQPWNGVGAEGRSEWVFASADGDSAEELYALWLSAVARSRNAVARFVDRRGPGGTFVVGDGVELSLRRLLVDMIEEYGRHTGHADLMREQIDGRVGEDPPGPARPFSLSTVPAPVGDDAPRRPEPPVSVFEAAGGMPAMRRIAAQWHDLAVVDAVVGHAFEHGFQDDNVERLACYLAEGLGGPAEYTSRFGSAADVARLHAGQGTHPDFDAAGIAVFERAVAAAGVPDTAAAAIVAYWAWTTRGPFAAYPHSADDVPADAPFPRWSWDGPLS